MQTVSHYELVYFHVGFSLYLYLFGCPFDSYIFSGNATSNLIKLQAAFVNMVGKSSFVIKVRTILILRTIKHCIFNARSLKNVFTGYS